MFKKNYYCLIAGLPDLLFSENKLSINNLTFRDELKNQLSLTDFNLIKTLFLSFDNQNLLNLLFNQNKPFNNLGNYSKSLLESQIIKPDGIPDYMIHYTKWLKDQNSNKFTLANENKLYQLFYEYVMQIKNDFVIKWFTFDLNIKNVLTAIKCKQFNNSVEKQIIRIDLNYTTNILLSENHLTHDSLEEVLPYSEQIFRIAESDASMIEKEKSIDKIKWDFLDEETFFYYFTIEKVMSFLIKLMITERWMKLDEETGKELLNKLIDELKTSYEFPAEYSMIK